MEIDHKEPEPGPQKSIRIIRNPSQIIKLRLPWLVFSEYNKQAEKEGFGSVALLCKEILTKRYPALVKEKDNGKRRVLKLMSIYGLGIDDLKGV